MSYPSYGAEQIRRHLTAAGDRGRQLDLMVLLAETYQRQGQARAAHEIIADARQLDIAAAPHDSRILVILGVGADLAVYDGTPAALLACARYREEATRATGVDRRRVLYADALGAISVYHHGSCGRGRGLLRMQAELLPPADPMMIMMRAAVEAIEDGCRTGSRFPPVRPLPPSPGGVLHPDLDNPPGDYLVSRIIRRSATHTCA